MQPYLAGFARRRRCRGATRSASASETARDGRAIDAEGRRDPILFIAGPLARGTFGELMGLPAVSVYARFIAGQIAADLTR